MSDTICAIATPLGYGGIGIVRVSGPDVAVIAERILGRCPDPRRVSVGEFFDSEGGVIDSGLGLYFQRPHSYTGEDVLELHGHGGIVVQQTVCERVQELGGRLAEPGEFTQRAFLNNRIDLTQAEAVADLISATSKEAARASAKSLTGKFSKAVHEIDTQLMGIRVFVEAAIDFAEEEIEFLSDQTLLNRVHAVQEQLSSILSRVRQGAVLHRGLDVVIAGEPNVGKSSLLNALLNEDRAIVTEIAGTTRDILDGLIHIGGLPIRLTDTAGLHSSVDRVEEEGIARARSAMDSADLVLWVTDDRAPKVPSEISNQHTVILNKCDLTGRSAGVVDEHTLRVSALEGKGVDELRTKISQFAGVQPTDDAFAGRPRHVFALESAQRAIDQAFSLLMRGNVELVAEELRSAQRELGNIVGQTTTDELLGEIFSQFCVGK